MCEEIMRKAAGYGVCGFKVLCEFVVVVVVVGMGSIRLKERDERRKELLEEVYMPCKGEKLREFCVRIT